MADRAVLFIDGNNWYHALKRARIRAQGDLVYKIISEKLVQHREWLGTRYYVGRVDQTRSPREYAAQRAFVAKIKNDDPRISVCFGRLEQREARNEVAYELVRYLNDLSVKIDPIVFRDLMEMGQRNKKVRVQVEKAVDVMLAVDLAMMAQRDKYDVAYILSADGDFTPAVREVRALDKKAFAASSAPGYQLKRECDFSIILEPDWFDDCYRETELCSSKAR